MPLDSKKEQRGEGRRDGREREEKDRGENTDGGTSL